MSSLALSRPKEVLKPKRRLPATAARTASLVERLLAAWDANSGVDAGASFELSALALASDPLLPALFAASPLRLELLTETGETLWTVNEASLPGLWLVCPQTGQASSGAWQLELARCPARIAIHAATAGRPHRTMPQDPPAPGLAELWAGLRQSLTAGLGETRVFNLSVPVLDPEAGCALTQALGAAAVLGRLEGQFLRQIASTRWQRVWRVQYRDANARVQLDTLEIGVLPECAAASATELAGTVLRLRALVRGEPGETQEGLGTP
ncbi:hypothetical protein BURK2_01475 [Burkholderiales bacterium]|nr:hypothetical protein BURK2_01475 [Burkholderiales bacterium]